MIWRWGADSAPDGAGHHKDQVIRGLELSAPPTNLWEGEGVRISSIKTLEYNHVLNDDDLITDGPETA